MKNKTLGYLILEFLEQHQLSGKAIRLNEFIQQEAPNTSANDIKAALLNLVTEKYALMAMDFLSLGSTSGGIECTIQNRPLQAIITDRGIEYLIRSREAAKSARPDISVGQGAIANIIIDSPAAQVTQNINTEAAIEVVYEMLASLHDSHVQERKMLNDCILSLRNTKIIEKSTFFGKVLPAAGQIATISQLAIKLGQLLGYIQAG